MKVLAIAGMNMTRLVRDRLGLFFVFLLPFIIILVMGAAFGGSFNPRLGVLSSGSSEFAADLVASIEDAEVDVFQIEDRQTLLDGVERGRYDGGLIIPADYDDVILGGGKANLELLAPPNTFGGGLFETVNGAAAEQAATIRAARFAKDEGVGQFTDNLGRVVELRSQTPTVDVAVRTTGESIFPAGFTPLAHGAQGMLVLFMFLTSLSAADKLVLSRTLGVSRRMLATPTSARTVILGETLGRFGVAMLQGLLILFGTAFAFGVDWGNPWLAALIVIVFALVGTGAAMLSGSLFRNAEQAGSIGVLTGLLFAAIGGAMVPFEVFPDTMKRISQATPHHWALRGFKDLIYGDGGIGSITTELGVLLMFAAGLLAIAVVRFRKAIVS